MTFKVPLFFSYICIEWYGYFNYLGALFRGYLKIQFKVIVELMCPLSQF